ncbi:MAG: general stress protein [Acidobacteriota bacterium]
MQSQAELIKENLNDSQTQAKGSVVAVYDSHEEAEKAVLEIQKSGFDMKQLSIVGQDFHSEEDVVGYYNNGDRMMAWGKRGAFWGGLWGMLFGSAFFFIPGVGPLLFAGPIVGWIIGALEGAVVVGGLSALGAGLYGMGIPKDSVVEYETQIKAGKFLVIAHGQPHDVSKIEGTLSNTVHHGIEGHPFVI